MHELIFEPVDVIAEYAKRRVHIRHIKWNGKTYSPQKMNFVHHTREGGENVIYFSVSDKHRFLKLRYLPMTFDWKITEYYEE
jgi:hypothetical protein